MLFGTAAVYKFTVDSFIHIFKYFFFPLTEVNVFWSQIFIPYLA